jgi:hypothetical protein
MINLKPRPDFLGSFSRLTQTLFLFFEERGVSPRARVKDYARINN